MMTPHWMWSLLALCLVGCAAPVRYDRPSKALDEKQRDYVECAATASQAAQGAGDWASDRTLRTAFYQDARDRYLALCLESRGWVRGETPLTYSQQERACQSYASETYRKQCRAILQKGR